MAVGELILNVKINPKLKHIFAGRLKLEIYE